MLSCPQITKLIRDRQCLRFPEGLSTTFILFHASTPKFPFPSPPESLNCHLQDSYWEERKEVPRRFPLLGAVPDDRSPCFPSSQPVNCCVKFKKREFTEPRRSQEAKTHLRQWLSIPMRLKYEVLPISDQ